ncbi:WD40 repeat domain-containing protein [Salinispora arenicola]|uniref:WD40 repeat domain-containing protein n=1 Tax=Salinispora arenicola TaxID=168697 RepID=UPI00037BC6CB|nr:hypothetical protein [Salinispora arenicola]
MEMATRVIRMIYRPDQGLLVADTMGRIHLLDDDLNVVRSSPVLRNGLPFYALAATDQWIVGKDRIGNIARWRADTLDLVDLLDARTTCDPTDLLPDEEPSMAIARGITIWRDKVYVNNGYVQMVVIDLPTFRVERIAPSPSGDIPLEWICTEHPEIHAISDKLGRLYLGNLETLDFPKVVKIDDRNSLHRVRYDQRHDRFWVTQDSGIGEFSNRANGIVTVSTKGEVEQELRFALDDVECLDFSADGNKAYAGGFDGVVQMFDNSSPRLRIERTYGPFTHQVSDVAIHPDGCIYVLTQDGELVRMGVDGQVLARLSFRRQCVWDIKPSIEDQSLLYCATDEGVTVLRVDFEDACGVRLETVADHAHGRGFSRRVVAVPQGWVTISRDQHVVRTDGDGTARWDVRIDGLIHTVAVSPNFQRVLLATNAGGIELDANTGEETARLVLPGDTIWACCYLETGERVLGAHSGEIAIFAPDALEPRIRRECGDYPKRMWQRGDTLIVTGGGGVREVTLDDLEVRRNWTELISNTCENAALVDGFVYAVSYDGQIAAFHHDSVELIGLLENLPDFPKGITVLRAPDGTPFLVVGGRGGFVSLYAIADGGVIAHHRDLTIARRGVTSVERLEVTDAS